MRLVRLHMRYNVERSSLFSLKWINCVPKVIFWKIGGYSYFGIIYSYILFKNKCYRIETIRLVKLCWNNTVSGKLYPSKYHGTYCKGLANCVVVLGVEF